MEPYKENGTVTLRHGYTKPPATRIISKRTSPITSGGISVMPLSSHAVRAKAVSFDSSRQVARHDLTDNNFSVTRARAHAYAHARENNRVVISKNNPGLRRVLDAALLGGDVKVAAIEPMSFSARLIAALLIPVMLVMPLAPAYANEAPLAERIASDVSEMMETTTSIATNGEAATLESAPVATTENTESPAGDSSSQTGEAGEVAGASSEITPPASDTTTPPEQITEEIKTEETKPTTEPVVNNQTTQTEVTPPVSSGGGSGGTEITTPATEQNTINDTPTSNLNPSATGTKEDVLADSKPVEEIQIDIPVEEPAAPVVDDTQVLDIPSPEVQEDLQALRARLRDEVKNEVKMEVRREIEREVYHGCKNLDGIGYYCIPDAKSFGTSVIANERSISVVVQQDTVEGDKEIFLVRNNSAIQLTHNTDDDVFPVLDPSSDLLVWQSLVKGHWQIAYAHVNDVGVPKVNYLTDGENNFNPKVYRGRIVWQAWIEGNWEIFQAAVAREKIEDDALTAEHRLAHVSGVWDVKRITANNAPDMFPSVTGDAVTWQAIDDGVWQVFSYDLETGEARRISRKGVKSESPRSALIWSEEDETGQIRLVGSDVNSTESIDFTALAKRLVDQSKDEPDSPITNTEIIITTPTTVKAEEEAV